jgi:predicted metal-dependent phosphoesterase TrpH
MPTLALDPHVHSAASYDATARVPDVLERAREVGLDAVAVTDHDRIEASLAAARRAPEYGLLGVPGVEVSTADGHLLALGVETCPPADRPFAETVATVRDLGGVAVVPHPFQRLRHGVGKDAIEDCDGVETLNACSLFGYRNRAAERFATRRGYARIGGSDAHSARWVGRAYTEVEVPCDPDSATVDAVVDAIRLGNTAVAGRRTPKRRYLCKYARNAYVGAASLL